jgi:hypothetical protein
LTVLLRSGRAGCAARLISSRRATVLADPEAEVAVFVGIDTVAFEALVDASHESVHHSR